MHIDVTFNFADDSNGKAPDAHGKTLHRYHQILWSNELDSGQVLTLDAPSARSRGCLIHTDSSGGKLWFGIDATQFAWSNAGCGSRCALRRRLCGSAPAYPRRRLRRTR